MRGFALLSFAAVALAAPTFLPVGSVANVVAPVTAPVDAAVGAVAHVSAPIDAAVANVQANYDNIANGVLDNNNIEVLHKRAVADVVAPVYAVLKGLVALCAQVGVDANAAIANVGIDYTNILNDSVDDNNVSVLTKRAVVDVLTRVLTAIFACVKALATANVPVNAIVGNISANNDQIANNVANGNTVHVARGLLTAIAPVAAAIKAVIPILVGICADINANILNVALNNNSIANSILDGNTIKIL